MEEIVSAGGVVFDRRNGELFILLCQPTGKNRWVFPKGKVGDKVAHEDVNSAALREVHEEAGAQAQIVKKLDLVRFWYSKKNGGKIHKTVHYFLMRFTGGDITRHDKEMQKVIWAPVGEVAHKLTFAGDRKLFEKAQKVLETI